MNYKDILTYYQRLKRESTPCIEIVGSKENLQRRVERYISGKDDMEFDVSVLSYIYLNLHPELTERERRIAYECHRRLLNFYQSCESEEIMTRERPKMAEEEFYTSPRLD